MRLDSPYAGIMEGGWYEPGLSFCLIFLFIVFSEYFGLTYVFSRREHNVYDPVHARKLLRREDASNLPNNVRIFQALLKTH